MIGAFIALAIDASIVSVAVNWGVPLLIARLLAMLAGVTTTYAFNRRFTFTPTQAASFADWGRYVAAQSVGTALNFGVSSALLFYSDRTVLQIWGAVLAGAAAGFCVNFFSARRLLHHKLAYVLGTVYFGGSGRELRMSTAVFGSRLAGVIGGTWAAARDILRM